MASARELEEQRRQNRAAAIDLGLDPYGSRTDGLEPLADARARYDPEADEHHREHGKDEGFSDRRPVVTVAGRVMLHRDIGKLIFMNLRDATGDLQIAVSKRDCTERGFALAKITDLADIVIARGPLVRTRTGEITVWASDLEPAAKALVPPPEKHAGLQDPEARYRQRYVDMWANPETTATLLLRSRLLARLRRFLEDRGFVEVETPMLQTLAGGAAARPFVTHMNALDIDLFLRVAPELYLKRLLVGGMPRVFEINRNFRNEGVDRQHNPEFTMLELYQAFGDYNAMMELTEATVRDLARLAAETSDADETSGNGSLVLPYGELAIDYERPFARVTWAGLFEKALGFAPDDRARIIADIIDRKLVRKAGTPPEGADPRTFLDAFDTVLLARVLFDDVAEEAIDPATPTFVIDWPAALCPLTRSKPDDPDVAERFELFIAGMELANAYTELNDPDIQERKFREQLAGIDDEEQTFRTLDMDFIRALKVGMPPAGGLGLGVDRLVMALLDQRSIRDVIAFPLMRPRPEEPV